MKKSRSINRVRQSKSSVLPTRRQPSQRTHRNTLLPILDETGSLPNETAAIGKHSPTKRSRKSKHPHLRTFKPRLKIKVKGATAPSGTIYVHVFAGGLSAWVRYAAFRSAAFADQLQAQGIVLLKKDAAFVLKLVEGLGPDKFPARPLIEQPGWSGRYYALPNGKVYGEKRGERPIVLFPKRKQKVAVSGTFQDWTANIARPLTRQALPTFALMIAFTGPLMRLMGNHFNIGVELAGPPSRGKSTLLYLASSVWGPGNSSTGPNYWQTANATMAGFEGIMRDHCDMAMIIDETNMLGQGQNKGSRADTFNHFVFAVSSGIPKAKHEAHRPQRYPFVYLTSTNEPLATILAGFREGVSLGSADRLNTVPIGPERPLGCFDTIPGGYTSASELATSLSKAVAKYHGRPIRKFLKSMVKERSKDREAFRLKLDNLINQFRTKMRVDESSGSQTRVAISFGLIYAAGVLAKQYGVLPKEMNVAKAATVAYKLNRAAVDPTSPLDRLLRFAQRPDLVKSSGGRWPKSAKGAIAGAAGFIWEPRPGRMELLMTEKAFEATFPYARWMMNDPEVQARMVTEGPHQKIKRRLPGAEGKRRVYCFRLHDTDMN